MNNKKDQSEKSTNSNGKQEPDPKKRKIQEGNQGKPAATDEDSPEYRRYKEWKTKFYNTFTCHRCGKSGHYERMSKYKDEKGVFHKTWECRATAITESELKALQSSKEWKDKLALRATLKANEVKKPIKKFP